MNKYKRNTKYRNTFIKNNMGIFGGGNYHCAYCGKILKPEKMCVDHLIPVSRVKKFGLARFVMWISGIRNINDYENLVPSCQKCNSKKGSSMGFWLIRGTIGRHFAFWLILWSIILAATIILLYEFRDTIVTVYSQVINYLNSLLG